MSKLPKIFYVDGESLIRMHECSHMAKDNQFVDGVRCIPECYIEERITDACLKGALMGALIVATIALVFAW